MAQARIGSFALRLWASSMATAQDAMPRPHVVGARGQDDGHACAEHDAGRIGSDRNDRFLASMLPASRSGTTRICAWPATGDLMPLIARRLGTDGVVEGKRAIEFAAGDLAAVGHLAERGCLDGGGNARIHGLDRREDGDLGRAKPEPGVEIDGVLHDVALGHQVGRDVHGGVGDEQRLRMRGNVHDEDVADAPAGAKPSLALGDRGQQLVRMQASLHQQLGFARAHERDGFLGRRLAVRRHRRSRRRRGRASSDFASLLILSAGPTSMGMINPASAASSAPRERGLVAGMRHRRCQRRQVLGGRDQPLVFLVLTKLGDGGLLWACAGPPRVARRAGADLRLTTSGYRATSPGMPPG